MLHDFPFDIALRKWKDHAYTVAACTAKGRQTLDDILGPGLKWDRLSDVMPGVDWDMTRIKPENDADMGLLTVEAINRGRIVGQLSRDYAACTRYAVGDDGLPYLAALDMPTSPSRH
jgi:hypothetical protein